jgi:hypothetical protein
MALLIEDCPRCGSSTMTFDVLAELFRGERHDWVRTYEIFCVCRHCHRSTTFIISLHDYDARQKFRDHGNLVAFPDSLNRHFRVEQYVNLTHMASVAPPEHLPEEIAATFREAATCLSVGCFNAAGTMFRLCIDMATRPLLPDPQNETATQPNRRQRRDLGPRLAWLFENGSLPRELKGLAECIREDGNDGAHVGSLTKADAEDLVDFTSALLERLFTEPTRLALAEERRVARRTRK